MERSRQRVETLRQISGVRVVAARLAEAKCVAAANEVAAMEGAYQIKQADLSGAVEGWHYAMSLPRLDPGANIVWGHAVNQAANDLNFAKDNVSKSTVALETAKQHMAETIANRRCTETLLTKACKKLAREKENRALADQADRITQMELCR